MAGVKAPCELQGVVPEKRVLLLRSQESAVQ